MSELFPKCQYTGNNTYDSKTKFKEYLIMYLEHYRNPLISEWIDIVKNHDMSSAKLDFSFLFFLLIRCLAVFKTKYNFHFEKCFFDWQRSRQVYSEQKQFWTFKNEKCERIRMRIES
jgi:hypothetical protein